jgi:putative RecB family exonuclease
MAARSAHASVTSTGQPETVSTSRLPKRLSPSRAKTFLTCPRSFFYGTILGITDPSTIHTTRGTLTHTALERIFDHPAGERTVEAAVPYVRAAWRVMLNPFATRDSVEPGSAEARIRDESKVWADLIKPRSKDAARKKADAADYAGVPGRWALEQGITEAEAEEELLSSAEEMVVNWFAMENPNRWDPKERELYVRATTMGVTLHGYIDRLDQLHYQGAERVVINDYKTGKHPLAGKSYSKYMENKILDDAWFAMKVYALLYWETHKVVPYKLRLIYVKTADYQEGVMWLDVTPGMLNETRKKLGWLWRDIQAAAASEEWEPKKNPLCGWCSYKEVCPAFGGDDTVLPQMQDLIRQAQSGPVALPLPTMRPADTDAA